MARTKGVTSKTAVWVIVILLIVGLAGFGATNFGGTVRNVGTVGDTPIDVNRYARELQQEINAFSAQIGTNMTLAQAQQFGIDRAVLQRIVSTVALENEASELGLSVGDETVREQILQIPAFQGLDGSFDREGYRFALDNAGLSEAQFETNLRAEIARTMLQGAVTAGVAVPPAFTDTILDIRGRTARFRLGGAGRRRSGRTGGRPDRGRTAGLLRGQSRRFHAARDQGDHLCLADPGHDRRQHRGQRGGPAKALRRPDRRFRDARAAAGRAAGVPRRGRGGSGEGGARRRRPGNSTTSSKSASCRWPISTSAT